MGFEEQLTGGHPNSLGNTVEVVEQVLQDRAKLAELFACYDSQDEVVRLRTSSALKRVVKAQPEWFEPYLEPLVYRISRREQPSTRWSFAEMMLTLEPRLSADQKQSATDTMLEYLSTSDDWIVLMRSAITLSEWCTDREDLRTQLVPLLKTMSHDSRKSVANKAHKLLEKIL